jgi:hypothetical protein
MADRQRPTRQKGFWQEYDRQIPFLDKQVLAEDREVFDVTGCHYQATGTFGAQWVLEVTRSNGDQAKIGLAATEGRRAKMQLLETYLQDPTNFIPAYIRTFRTNNGQTGYDLADPFEEETVPESEEM